MFFSILMNRSLPDRTRHLMGRLPYLRVREELSLGPFLTTKLMQPAYLEYPEGPSPLLRVTPGLTLLEVAPDPL